MPFKLWATFALLSLAPWFSSHSGAMTILAFGKMNDDDEATFVTLLVEGSAKMFKDQGQPDQAAKVIAFFKVPGRDGGVYKLGDQIKQAYAANVKNGTNPNNRTPDLLVEDAMAATLRDRGLPVPAKYLIAVGKDFHPIGPPRGKT